MGLVTPSIMARNSCVRGTGKALLDGAATVGKGCHRGLVEEVIDVTKQRAVQGCALIDGLAQDAAALTLSPDSLTCPKVASPATYLRLHKNEAADDHAEGERNQGQL
jgi:hypothetical protein